MTENTKVEEVKALASSRPLGVAVELGVAELDADAIYKKRVVLIGELDTLRTSNGQWCFVDSLRLLSRVVGVLEVVVPDGLVELQSEVDELITTIWTLGTVRRVAEWQVAFDGAAAILNVGVQVRPDLPWTSILANGWVARCTSGNRPLPSKVDQANPVSCLMAASFGVTEVFKRVYSVPEHVAPPMDNAAFSLFELASEFKDYGPQLPSSIKLPEALILGAGAIGNGVILLLSQLPLTGKVMLMDKQTFAPENFGTCALFDSAAWLGKPKAEMLASWLQSRSALEVNSQMTTIEGALASTAFTNEVDLVINGLDDVGARRAVQKLWPTLLVDGAINSAGAAVVTHDANHRRFACLRCTFPEPNEDHTELQAKATGLNMRSLEGNQNRLINDEDIAMANESAREGLREQQRSGQTICSTVSSGVAHTLGLKLAEGFRPSVPFVATASATLVVAQVLRSLLWKEQRFVHELQFSSLFVGASTAVTIGRLASPNCECTRNATVIDAIIARRKEKEK